MSEEKVLEKQIKPKKEKKNKEPKIIELKQFKCTYCKQLFPEDQLVEWYSEPKKETSEPKKVRACIPCRQEKLDRKEFIKTLEEWLGIPLLSAESVKRINYWVGQGHEYKTMLHALKTKKNDIIKNKNKPEPYVLAIINNQLNLSMKILKDKENQEKNKVDINIETYGNTEEVIYKPKQSNNDISDFLN